jgi:hypothetical protein
MVYVLGRVTTWFVVAKSWRCVFVLQVAAVVVSDRDTTISNL